MGTIPHPTTHSIKPTACHLPPMVEDGDVVALDEKGRVSVPRHIREELGLTPGEKLLLSVDDGELRLRPAGRKQPKVKAGRRWGRDAFLSAGEALVAGEE